ncbi:MULTISPECIES: phenylalanine--tRNA ligase subunit beta [unclassified Moraxella]|uniref:phenylalanine--tRNA ligase subunit beta n=1 Tax=unclassified Moraxella TaxID=2685852 RepID=UPI003AF8C27E
MKISENWLRQWANPTLTAEQIGEQLTMTGLELDDLTRVAKDFSGVVIGEVLTCEQHPDADRLRVTTVNVGEHSETPLQIVCGAPNVAVGVRVPVALVGAKLPPAQGDEPFTIKKGKLRGVESQGMLCGGSEIDCDDGVDGLLLLPSDAPIGMDVRAYLGLDNHVLDISITPNRGDCFSVRGIARELAVLNNLEFKLPFDNVTAPVTENDVQAVNVTTTDCPRYYAQVVSGLTGTTASPDWLKQALTASNVKPRNLLVDVTNYVLLELGQPLHAFDAEKLVGAITVRHAKQGETLTLLNEQDITLTGDELVIADEEGVIALAGIMGGLRTAVTDDTQKVVIESAFFAQLAIAGKARRFGLHTDASQRFERGVDFELPKLALDRAVNLLHTLGGGKVGQITLVEKVEALPKREAVRLPVTSINKLLGADIATETAVAILNSLQISTTVENDTLVATPPSHRFDIAISEDLVEEIARIYGYNNIANRLPAFEASLFDNKTQNDLHNLKMALVNQGYFEAVSFSFSDAKIEQLFDSKNFAEPLALANPISADLAVMRRTLLSSLLACVQYNLNRQATRVRLFETGLRFDGSDIASLNQVESLALVAVGTTNPEQPLDSRAMDFYDLKHDVEAVMPRHALSQISYQRSQQPFLHSGQSADILVDGNNIGWLGQLHPQVAKALDLPTTWVAQLDLQALIALQNGDKTIASPSKFPHVRRDIALLVDKAIAVQDILADIRATGGELLKDSWLFDVYEGDKLPEGKRSLAFGLVWQEAASTLADDKVNQAMQQVVERLATNHQATLRD